MGAAPGRAKTCKIMQIAFVRTSSSLPLTPCPPPSTSGTVAWLVDFLRSQARVSLSLSFPGSFSLPVSLPLIPISPLFFAFSPLPFPSLLILCALLLRPAASITVVRAILFYLSVDPARARASVKNVSTIVCRGVCSFIFAEGVEYQAGRGCRCCRRAPGDETSPAIFTSLCREWEAEKSPGNREIRRSPRTPLTMALSPPLASLITADMSDVSNESMRLRSREIHPCFWYRKMNLQ